MQRVVIVAAGTSHHAALVAKYALERWAQVSVEVDISSEYRYRDPVVEVGTLVIGVSQSGETIDTIQAMREAKRRGARVVAVSNVVDSSSAREADAVIYTRAGLEVSVASTKAYVAQVAALELLALRLAQLRSTLAPADIEAHFLGLAAVGRPGRAGPRAPRRRRGGRARARRGPRLLLPGPPRRLPDRAGGGAQAQGGHLPARRGLPGRRAQARAPGPDRAGRRGGRRGHRSRAAREDALEPLGGQGPRRERGGRGLRRRRPDRRGGRLRPARRR